MKPTGGTVGGIPHLTSRSLLQGLSDTIRDTISGEVSPTPSEASECPKNDPDAKAGHMSASPVNVRPGDMIGRTRDGKYVNLSRPRYPEVLAELVESLDVQWFDERKATPTQYKVNHPSHYGGADNPYEAIKVIEAWNLGFNLGNVVKYISRAEKKGNTLEDLKKAAWYLNREIQQREKQA